MKRVLIGGFLSLIGSIWALAIILQASADLASEWTTPPGRLLSTIAGSGMMPFFVISIGAVLLGLVSLVVEYFRKED